jgi:hypothetical protein
MIKDDKGQQIFLLPNSHPQLFPIGNELDGAILICLINVIFAHPVNQSLHHLKAGMVKGVVFSDANHCHFRVNRSQKLRGGGGLAAMVGYLGD